MTLSSLVLLYPPFSSPLISSLLSPIGKYYAVEDMLTTNPIEKFGQVTLKQVSAVQYNVVYSSLVIVSAVQYSTV